jgi:hypothetical protein
VDHEQELLDTIADLTTENRILRARIARDRRDAEAHIAYRTKLATDADERQLRQQLKELQRTLRDEKAFIDCVVVYLRKKNYLHEGNEEEDE